MTRHHSRSLLIAAASLMVALPIGWASGEMPQSQAPGKPVPYAAQQLP